MKHLLLSTTALALLAAMPVSTTFAKDALSFTAIAAPSDDAAKRLVVSSPSVTIDGATAPLAYRTLLRSGDKLASGTFGLLLDAKGQALMGKDGAPLVSASTDFSSILRKNGQLYVVSHFENSPAAVYLTHVEQGADGMLKALDTMPIDFSADGGLWVPCAGSITPWGTHLGSEEYEPDARKIEAATTMADVEDMGDPATMAMYFGFDPATGDLDGFRQVFNPYAYGYITEIAVNDDGTASGNKHYAMGRFAHELGLVLPDEKTAYLSDDGTNVSLYRFVADEAGKLDAGTLYAVKFNQTSADNGGEGDVSWIDLGHASSAEVKALIDQKLTFSDMFEVGEMNEDGTCGEGFGVSIANGVIECLKVKPGMELAASRLETRRFAALQGATVELRKEEGVTFDPDHNRLYVAMSEIGNGMADMASDGKYEKGGNNDFRVAANPCGGVYALDLDASYVAVNMKGLVVGKPASYPEGDQWAGNTCDIDGIGNPDNISYIPGRGTLLIGEDATTAHQNDAVWSYDLATAELTRILTTPYGAESTSVYAYPNINEFGYVMAVVQHPYGESDEDKLQSPNDAQAYLGYIGPFPKFD